MLFLLCVLRNKMTNKTQCTLTDSLHRVTLKTRNPLRSNTTLHHTKIVTITVFVALPSSLSLLPDYDQPFSVSSSHKWISHRKTFHIYGFKSGCSRLSSEQKSVEIHQRRKSGKIISQQSDNLAFADFDSLSETWKSCTKGGKERFDVGRSGALVPSEDATTRLVDTTRLNAAIVYPEFDLTLIKVK